MPVLRWYRYSDNTDTRAPGRPGRRRGQRGHRMEHRTARDRSPRFLQARGLIARHRLCGEPCGNLIPNARNLSRVAPLTGAQDAPGKANVHEGNPERVL